MKKLSLMMFIFLFVSSIQVMAQGVLTYGSANLSNLSATAPIAIYTFQGTAGDQVTIQAISISPDLDLSLSIQAGSQILAVAEDDPFSGSVSDARVDLLLPSNNTYLVLVSSPSAQTGDFLIKLNGLAAADKTTITGLPADVPIVAGETNYYSFSGSDDNPTILSLSAVETDLIFSAIVRNNSGQIVSTVTGTSAIISVSGAGDYEIALKAIDPTQAGTVAVTSPENLVSDAPEPVATEEATNDDVVPVTATIPPTSAIAAPDEPATTEEVEVYETPILTSDDVCGVFSGGFPNIRSGPTVNDTIVGQIQPNVVYAVVGVYTNWYQIIIPTGITGWVRDDVVGLGGNCADVPAVSPDNQVVIPTSTPTATYTPTPTQATATTQPTATYTPSYTPTTPATATYTPSYTPTTPPPPPVAPEDARFNSPLNIPLDSTVSVTDFVSYPGGDTQDMVRWDITGMNSNTALSGGRARLIIAVSCFGTGTANIEFFTGGQTYSCGQTIVDQEVTFNSKTGTVTMTAIGGEGTYVQWVLTGTATRIN